MRKPHVCFVLPGVNYCPSNAYALSILPVVPHLQKHFEVTLAYRKVLSEVDPQSIDHAYTTILGDKAQSKQERRRQHRYFNPETYVPIHQYRQDLNRFAEENAARFDYVIEQHWVWGGAAVNAFARQGVPGGLILEAWRSRKRGNLKTEAKAAMKGLLAPGLETYRKMACQRWIQRADSIFAETQEMCDILQEQQYVNPKVSVRILPMGVNPKIFYPRDRNPCRELLNIPIDKTALVYVGSLSRGIQDPAHLIEALGRQQRSDLVLYIVGDGDKRDELEAIAQKYNAPVVFTGRVPQAQAAQYIGAADLCVAPYSLSMFFQNRFTSCSLKVPEYLSSGRLVLTTDCNQMKHLTEQQKYGYLVDHTLEGYQAFIEQFPSLKQLRVQEQILNRDLVTDQLRQKGIVLHWSDIADRYRETIDAALYRRQISVPTVGVTRAPALDLITLAGTPTAME